MKWKQQQVLVFALVALGLRGVVEASNSTAVTLSPTQQYETATAFIQSALDIFDTFFAPDNIGKLAVSKTFF